MCDDVHFQRFRSQKDFFRFLIDPIPLERIYDMGKRVVLIERLAELPELAHTAEYHPHALAVLLNVTLRALERECHDCFGMSPIELLSELWLMEAKRLLKGELAKQVFDKAGCKCMPHFSRKFKVAAGVTIIQWQESSDEESRDTTAKLFTLLSRNGNSEKLLPKIIGVKGTQADKILTTKAPPH
jgi:AraC-like DNA-binding protein